VLDIYPYATTSPVYLDLPGGPPPDAAAASYFAAWLDRTIADAEARIVTGTPRERDEILAYLRKARDRFRGMADGEGSGSMRKWWTH